MLKLLFLGAHKRRTLSLIPHFNKTKVLSVFVFIYYKRESYSDITLVSIYFIKYIIPYFCKPQPYIRKHNK